MAQAPETLDKRKESHRVIKRSIQISGHRTSVSLEEAFWLELKSIAGKRQMSLAQLVAEIDLRRDGANLSSALRIFILQNCKQTGQ